MSGMPLLTLTTFLPLAGALFILMIRAQDEAAILNIRRVALITTVATFLLSIGIWTGFDPKNPGFQLTETAGWSGSFFAYRMGVDGISILFVLLTTFLMPFCILASWESVQVRVKEYMIAFLVLETLMIGVFCATDLVLFYVFFEGGLIPMFLIIGIWGGQRRVYASYKFFLYTLAGSVLMMLAIMAMYWESGTTDITELVNHPFPATMQWWLWFAFFASFAVKMPMWPVHTWLPDAHVEAPTAGSVLLAAILLKMGGYGFLRFSLPMFPLASVDLAPFIFTLSVVAIVYTSLVALVQEDMKKLIAYSSVAHMGYVTMGIFTAEHPGAAGRRVPDVQSWPCLRRAVSLRRRRLRSPPYPRDRRLWRPRQPHAGLCGGVHGHDHGQRRSSRHIGVHRRVPDAVGRIPGQYLGGRLCRARRHPVGGLRSMAVPPGCLGLAHQGEPQVDDGPKST